MSGSTDDTQGVENIDTVDLEVDEDTVENDLDAYEDDYIMSDLVIEELSVGSSFSMDINMESKTDDGQNVKEIRNDNDLKGDKVEDNIVEENIYAVEDGNVNKSVDCEMEAEEGLHMKTETTKDVEAGVEDVQQENLVTTSSGDAENPASSADVDKIADHENNESSKKAPLTEDILKGILNFQSKDQNAIKEAETSLMNIFGTCAADDMELLMAVREKDDKMAKKTVAIILKTFNQVLSSKLLNIEEITIRKLVKFALKELTKSSKTDPAIQNPALEVLVTIGKEKALDTIMEELAAHTKSATFTHFMILRCLGKLIVANLLGMAVFMKTLLTTLLLPVAVDPKSVRLKMAQTYAIRCLCEALDSSQNAPPAESDTHKTNPNPRKTESLITDFKEEIYSTYNLLYNQWLHSREPKICVDILQTLSSLGSLFTRLESGTKTCGSVRKRMAILLKLGVGIDEAKVLAKRPRAELKYLYAPNRPQLWQRSMGAGKNLNKNIATKTNTSVWKGNSLQLNEATNNSSTALNSGLVATRPQLWQRSMDGGINLNRNIAANFQTTVWKGNSLQLTEATNNSSRALNSGPLTNISTGSNHPACSKYIVRKLSGAGKRRLNILLSQGMDVETARIKALQPLSHWKLTPAERIKISQIQQNAGKKKNSGM